MAQENTPAAAPLADKISRIQGPMLVLGASGFVGANLMRTLIASRQDVFGTTTRKPAWRLEDLPDDHVRMVDLLIDSNLDALLNEFRPRTIFNCVAYGAYSFEADSQLIYRTNFNFVTRLLTRLESRPIACYLHAGSSSEYGDNAAGPTERDPLAPNSDYAVSKVAAANLIYFYGKRKRIPCANLRLYSVYGPLEDSSRLIPNVIRHGLDGTYPEFVNPAVSRDFVYVDDVTEAFVDTALNLTPGGYGESINIGSGRKTTIAEVAATCRDLFGITAQPCFTMPDRHWDVQDWYANIGKARECIGWTPRTCFCDGLNRTADWYRALPDKTKYHQSSKKFGLDTVYSVTAVVACYKDNLAIPIMYERLKATFTKLNIDFEIIFVNDCSPDDSEEVIRSISGNDRRVLGISHSRNFGSQSAFRSGMEIASKNACVLLDGDLQDPPELIEQFVALWREGYDVVYGRRVKREATLFMQFAYKAFYRVFDYFSYVTIPHDAGDFSLMDRRVVRSVLQFPERDLFLRGVRAFAGFKQTGVDYVRPERMFGVSTNNLLKNLDWAKKGILSFSNTPLNMMTFTGVHPVRGLTSLAGPAPDHRPVTGSLPRAAPSRAGCHHDSGAHHVLWFPEFSRTQRAGRVSRQGVRGGQAPAALHPAERDPRRRGPPVGRRPARWQAKDKALTELLDRTNMVGRQSEAWRPPSFHRVTTRTARLTAAARRVLDLQAGSIWDDLVVLLPRSRGMVLDVGCGAQPYRHLLSPEAIYRAIDYTGADRHFGYSMPDTTYYQGERWPVADASVDVVLCTETLEHVSEPAVFLAEAVRCLKPGGRLILTVPFAARWHYIPHDYWRFTPSGLKRLLSVAGFEQVAVYARGNALTVACYKVMALLLPLLMPQRKGLSRRLLLLACGVVVLPMVVALAAIGNSLAERQQGGRRLSGLHGRCPQELPRTRHLNPTSV